VYRTYLAPRSPFARKDVNALPAKPVKMAPQFSTLGGNILKENIPQPRNLARRKAVRYPRGINPTPAIFTEPFPDQCQPKLSLQDFKSPNLSNPKASRTGPVNHQDFDFRHLLGSGAQGRVYLTRYLRQTPSPLLAVKVLKKRSERDTECVRLEHQALKRLRGKPFLLYLEAAYNDNLNWYLVTVRLFL
jgi:hypothetical protein